jgi:hypothetical protein
LPVTFMQAGRWWQLCLHTPLAHCTFNSCLRPATRVVNTHLLSSRSVLLPTRKIMTSLPRSVRTSWIHRAVLMNEERSAPMAHTHSMLSAHCFA